MLAVLAMMSCSFELPDCASGYERNEAEECEAVVVPEDNDTGDVVTLSGEYSGDIVLSVLAETGGLVIEDDCVGTVAFNRLDSDLDGTVECKFQGSVDGLVGSKRFEGTLDGQVGDSGATTGQIVLDLDIFGVLDEPWTGSTTAETVTGVISGQMDFEVGGLVVPVQFDGEFDASR